MCCRYLKDSNFPLEEAKRLKPEYNQDQGKDFADFHALESDIYVRICVAEALQVKDIGRLIVNVKHFYNL